MSQAGISLRAELTYLGRFSRPPNASVNTEVIYHRVGNTPIALKISLNRRHIIDGPDMARTLLQTQVSLRRYIARYYRADEDVLFPSDDPYTSSEANTGCFFGVTHFPENLPKRLTYGMVESILTGVFDVLYRGNLYVAADILMIHDNMGMVGFGRVTKDRPGQWVQSVAVE